MTQISRNSVFCISILVFFFSFFFHVLILANIKLAASRFLVK